MPHFKTLYSIARLAGQLVCLLSFLLLAGAVLTPFIDAGLPAAVLLGRILIGSSLVLMGASLVMKSSGGQSAASRTFDELRRTQMIDER